MVQGQKFCSVKSLLRVLTASVVLAACGTTTTVAEQRAGNRNDPFSPEGAFAADGPDSTAIDGGRAPQADTPGGSISTRSATASATTVPGRDGGNSRPGGPIPAGRGVRGVSASTILVGLPTTDLESADNQASGQTGSSGQFGNRNLKKAGNAVVEYINANGGIAGRKVEPIWFHIDPAVYASGPEGRQQVQQSACAKWTEDNQVFAVVGAYMGEENMLQCMARTKTVFISSYLPAYISNERFSQLHDIFYAPHFLLAQRRERALVDALWDQGFFTPGAKIAAVVEDSPGIRAGVNLGMKPALAARGLTLDAEIVYRDGKTPMWTTYAFELRRQGITHILMSGTTSGFFPLLLLMQAADSHDYEPRYGIATDNQPLSLRLFNAPRSEMARAQGMGWLPLFDVGEVSPQSDNGRICESINKAAGQPAGTAEVYCEGLFFLKTALDRSTVVSPAGMAGATAQLGDGFRSVYTIAGLTRFSDAVHDGPAQYRDLAYDDRCGQSGAECFKYTSPPKPLR